VKYRTETQAHADHLTATRYLQQKLIQLGQPRPKIAIGKRITLVQSTFAGKFGMEEEEMEGVFDELWDDGEEFQIGNLKGEVIYLPGATPDHVGTKSKGMSSLATPSSTLMLDPRELTSSAVQRQVCGLPHKPSCASRRLLTLHGTRLSSCYPRDE
jgi:hypothetical protein